MDRIRELLAILAQAAGLPADELEAARTELALALDEFLASDDALTDDGFALAQQAQAVGAEVGAIVAEREAAVEERRAQLATIREELIPDAPSDEDEGGEQAADGDGEPEPVPAEAEVIAEAEVVEDVPTPVAARATVPLAVIGRHQPAKVKGETHEPRGPIVTAAPDLRDFAAGSEMTADQAAEAMSERLEAAAQASPGMPAARMRAGRVSWSHQYPDDRVVKASQPELTDARFSGVIGEYPGDPRALEPIQRDGNGMIATGGLCAPVTIRYELETVSVADRPLRAALPSFNADRGGIQFNTPAHLVDILADQSSAALTTVTVANDVSAVTKTVQEVACGTLQTVQVRAIAERLQFSNFADRYNPERMKQFMQLARSAHSRLCERELYEDMRASGTLVNGGAVWVGALRQWGSNIIVAAEGMRYRHRMDEAYPIRAVIPRWLVRLVAIDLGLQANGEQTVQMQFDAEAVMTRWLSQGNVRPIFQRDDARTNNALGADAPAFTTQTGSGAALADFPGRVSTLLFPEGSFLFLDGGSLDFGIIRDSTLNAANRFQTFYEVFEAVAYVGVECLNVVTQICASGQGIAGTTTTKCGGSGS